MEDNSSAIYFIAAIVSIVVWYFATQWVHQIDKRNRYMEAQIRLLAHIALKQETDTDKISDILAMSEVQPMKIYNAKQDQ